MRTIQISKHVFLSVVILLSCQILHSQGSYALYTYETKIVTNQLGFMPQSHKLLTLVPAKDLVNNLKDEIPFYIQNVGNRKKRATPGKPAVWTDAIYRWPFDISKGTYVPSGEQYHKNQGEIRFSGMLKKVKSRWGEFWQADFSNFTTVGLYQIETEFGFTTPFCIEHQVYERLEKSFLHYVYCQRSGVEIPGVRPAENADDAVLDTDKNHALPLSGGWNDAGDTRKWLSQTLGNLEALATIAQKGHQAFKQQAIEEIVWGNKYYYFMINDSGRVYEDVGAGSLRPGMTYSNDWWLENHAGCVATGGKDTDNQLNSGDERQVRTTYNPLVQFLYIRSQAISASVLPAYERNKSLILAERAWDYSQNRVHDGRTLFLCQELWAALELYASGSVHVTKSKISALVQLLLSRQQIHKSGISGYFTEKDNTDGYRSIAFSCDPALALLRFCELNIPGLESDKQRSEQALAQYAKNYLLKDAASNPFGLCPYGVYYQPDKSNIQTFRQISTGKYIRTFMAPFNPQEMVHGIASVSNQQAYFFARAFQYFGDIEYKKQSEILLMWTLGHNPYELCLATGVGFKHPIQASFVNYKIPDAHVVGFIGRPDDTPYIETSNAVEWNTQEVWGVPFQYLVQAVLWLKK